MRLKLFAHTALLLFALSFGAGTARAVEPPTRYGADLISPAVPHVFDGDLRDQPRAPESQSGDPIIEIPKQTYPRPGLPPAGPPEPRLDPLLELQEEALDETLRSPEQKVFTVPVRNFAGQGFSGINPPDTVGDVGPARYIQAINSPAGTSFVIYDKSGAVLAGPIALGTLASPVTPCANGQGDPIVLYDELAGRWLLSELAQQGTPRLCVYVSRTNDPVAGGWFSFEFVTPEFPDYPKYGVWPDAYYVTTNESSPTVYALDRNQMLAGAAATLQRFTVPSLAGFPFQALTPADLDGPTPPPADSPGYLMRHRDDEAHNVGSNDPTRDFVELWELSVDFADPMSSSLTGPLNIPVAEFDSNLCGLVDFWAIAQPGAASCEPPPAPTSLDPLREVIMWRLQYRNFGGHETLVGNFVTDVDGGDRAGKRWFELRKSVPGIWALHQEGTWSPDVTNRWMGAVAMDNAGNIGLGYNVAEAFLDGLLHTDVFPGLRYTGRRAGDPLGVMTEPETTLATGLASNSVQRYGDYSAMSVDPADGCTFWFTGEWNPAADWETRIGAFRFNDCGPVMACSAPGIPIADGPGPPAVDRVSLARNGPLADVDVLIRTAHTWVGDLVFTLSHDSGGMPSTVTLIDRPGVPLLSSVGCSGDDIEAILDDEAPTPVENECGAGTPTISGFFSPNAPLSAFDGEDVGGDWELSVTDNAPSNVGTLVEWCVLPWFQPPSPCTDTNLALNSILFQGTTTCTGFNSFTAQHTKVGAGADVTFVGPRIGLNAGFAVQTGSTFRARIL